VGQGAPLPTNMVRHAAAEVFGLVLFYSGLCSARSKQSSGRKMGAILARFGCHRLLLRRYRFIVRWLAKRSNLGKRKPLTQLISQSLKGIWCPSCFVSYSCDQSRATVGRYNIVLGVIQDRQEKQRRPSRHWYTFCDSAALSSSLVRCPVGEGNLLDATLSDYIRPHDNHLGGGSSK